MKLLQQALDHTDRLLVEYNHEWVESQRSSAHAECWR